MSEGKVERRVVWRSDSGTYFDSSRDLPQDSGPWRLEMVAERDIPEDSEAEKLAKENESQCFNEADHDCVQRRTAAMLRQMDRELKEARK